MRAPEFWYHPSSAARRRLTGWLGAPYATATSIRLRSRPRHRLSFPGIGVGNLTVGGAGKTPVVLALIAELRGLGRSPVVLARGYGGRLRGPVRVEPEHHEAPEIGDEPLLHAAAAPTFVARDRAAGARAIEAAVTGLASPVLLVDDGHQDPALAGLHRLLVIDGRRGFGNGMCLPAGPLREPVEAGLARAEAVLMIDPDDGSPCVTAMASVPRDRPVLRARRRTAPPPAANAGPWVAFAGIADPARFRAGLEAAGWPLAAWRSFPDHHRFETRDLDWLRAAASQQGARLVTTAKDHVRLPRGLREEVTVAGLSLDFEDRPALIRLLDGWTAES